jgi:hypothetical protein
MDRERDARQDLAAQSYDSSDGEVIYVNAMEVDEVSRKRRASEETPGDDP